MKRIAIVLVESLPMGNAANVAAILMGQLSLDQPGIYDSEILLDANGNRHAGIQFNTVLLKGRSGQIVKLVEQAKTANVGVSFTLFGSSGIQLSNSYTAYRDGVKHQTTEQLAPVGVALFGEDVDVRGLTRKFSVL